MRSPVAGPDTWLGGSGASLRYGPGRVPATTGSFSGAAAYVLGALFPGDTHRLEEMAYDAGVSRIFGGIHYRFDADAGLQIARAVSGLALESDRGNGLLELLP